MAYSTKTSGTKTAYTDTTMGRHYKRDDAIQVKYRKPIAHAKHEKDKKLHALKAPNAKKALKSAAESMRRTAKTQRVNSAKAKVAKAKTAQKAAQSRLKEGYFSRAKKAIKKYLAGDNKYSKRVSKQTGVKTDSQRRKAK